MLCGDLGHTNRDGRLCRKRQGWGIEGAARGPCRYHYVQEEGTMDAIKKEVLHHLRDPNLVLREVCRKVGRAPNTVWRWQQDKEFGKECSEALASANSARVQMVEEAMFLRTDAVYVGPGSSGALTASVQLRF